MKNRENIEEAQETANMMQDRASINPEGGKIYISDPSKRKHW